MTTERIDAQCCVVGGGPAGMMTAFLLARAGVDVVVLEKHADFLRDFRGDTIHPSTLQIVYELDLLDAFLKLPHQKAEMLSGQIGDFKFTVADFRYLPTHCRYVLLMPQWDFLDFIAAQGKRYPGFKLLTKCEATDLIEEGGRVVGLRARAENGEVEIRSGLVIGADGRHSVVRQKAGFVVDALGAPMDVLWFRVSRSASDPAEVMGIFDAGRIFVMINRGDYWQCGYVIAKGTLEQVRQAGLPAFRESVLRLAPFLGDRASELADWDQIKLLTVGVDRLRQWYRPGVLCIGDAAHTMSPVGGVGINLAIQDAVATANLLAAPLRERRLTDADGQAVQKRREFPARFIQRGQVFVQDRVITRVLGGTAALKPPLVVRLLARFPFLRRIPARIIGLGVRPEHVQTVAMPIAAGYRS
jgi:2-polyprenyl-6-methoxyphenol hydroxylase-like FAD-dependent oxidoreductase